MFTPGDKLKHEDEVKMQQNGLMCHYPEASTKILLPIVLKKWATDVMKGGRQSIYYPLTFHVNGAFLNDQINGCGREKHAENELFHVEAAIRVALAITGVNSQRHIPVVLDKLFDGAILPEHLSRRAFYTFNPKENGYLKSDMPHNLLCRVPNFHGHVAQVLENLAQGLIVVSEDPNEPAIEYLSPLWDKRTSEMIILGVQVSSHIQV